jgi:predicted dehydrogenase
VISEVLACSAVRAIVAEKPLALDLGAARQLVEEARRRGVLLIVNYSRRFAPTHITARERITAGDIGRVQLVAGLYTKGIMHNGTHWFDLARWLVGEIMRVQAWPAPPTRDGDPACHVRAVFAEGQAGFLLATDADHFTVFEMDVVGTTGRLRITDSGVRFTWSTVADSPRFSGYRVLEEQPVAPAGFRDVALHLVEDVVTSLARGTRPRCTGDDGVAALAIAHAAIKSLGAGSAEQTV